MSGGLSTLRILVVDDSDQMRTIIGTVLTGAGITHVQFAPNGVHGLRALAAKEFDVIYVDYEMGGMNGLDFITAVRAMEPPDRFIPIIMLTGHSDVKRINEARDRGVTEFLAKPVSAKTILSRLSAVIDHPRPFIKSGDYFGPDRRRKIVAHFTGPWRRATDTPRGDDAG